MDLVHQLFSPSSKNYSISIRIGTHAPNSSKFYTFPPRSFYLSRKTDEYAKNNPEEGDECREIVKEYKDISFHLLDQCHNTNEAQLVLEDHTGKQIFKFQIKFN